MNKQIFSFLLLVLLLSSCGTVHYPQTVNVPLLKEKGQNELLMSANPASATISGAKAIGKNTALAASLNVWKWNASFFGPINKASGIQLHILPGIYKPFGKAGVAELYGGYGLANINWNGVQGLTHQFIVQPSVGWGNDKAQISFTARASYLTSNLYYPSFDRQEPKVKIEGLFIDPAITLKYGGQRIKAMGQLGFSYEPSGKSRAPQFLFLSAGIGFSFWSEKSE